MEDFYEEQTSKKTIILVLVVVVGCIVGIILLFNNYRKKYTLNVKNNLVFEVGDKVSYNPKDYITNDILSKQDYSINLLSTPIENDIFTMTGEYEFQVTYKSITKKGKLKVKDTKGPKVTTKDLTVGVKEDFNPGLFVEECEEYSKPCDVSYKNQTDAKLNQKEGSYRVDLVISDTLGNKTYTAVNLTVKKGYSLEKVLTGDTTISYMDPEFEDFDGVYFIKYDEAIEEHDMLESEEYEDLLECMDNGWRKYMPELYKLNRIDEADIITIYNKYDYVIGFAVRLKLDSKKVLYLRRDGAY